MKWENLIKIGISGSRQFPALAHCVTFMERYIRRQYSDTDKIVIIHGGAIGVDSIIQSMCVRQGIKQLIILPRWLELQKAAGHIRNRHIVQLSDELFAFWDKKSPGTKGFIDYARNRFPDKPLSVFTPKKLRKHIDAQFTPSYEIDEDYRPPERKKTGKKTVRTIRDAIKDVGGVKGLKNIFDMEDWNEG